MSELIELAKLKPNAIVERVCVNLRSERLRKRIGINKFSELAGLSSSTLRQWEGGIFRPTLFHFLTWCTALGVDHGEVIKRAMEEVASDDAND